MKTEQEIMEKLQKSYFKEEICISWEGFIRSHKKSGCYSGYDSGYIQALKWVLGIEDIADISDGSPFEYDFEEVKE